MLAAQALPPDVTMQDAAGQDAPRLPLSFRTPEEICAWEFDDSDIVLDERLMAKGQPLNVCGAGGVGKSRMMLQMAACTTTGRPFIGINVHNSDISWRIFQTENSNRRLKFDQWKDELEGKAKRKPEARCSMERVGELLRPKQPLTKPELAKLMRDDTGLARSGCYDWIGNAERAGMIKVAEDGLLLRVSSIVVLLSCPARPYRGAGQDRTSCAPAALISISAQREQGTIMA